MYYQITKYEDLFQYFLSKEKIMKNQKAQQEDTVLLNYDGHMNFVFTVLKVHHGLKTFAL